jgi:hypothetical protein
MPTITIAADTLRLALPHLSTEASRPILNALCVESTGVIVATNGHTLAAIPAAATWSEDDDAPASDVLIRFHKPREAMARKVEAVRFDSDGTPQAGVVVTLLGTCGTVIGAALADIVDGPFPDWRQVVPREEKREAVSHIGMNPDVLARFDSWGTMSLTFHGERTGVVIRSSTNEHAIGLLMPATYRADLVVSDIPMWARIRKAPTEELATA